MKGSLLQFFPSSPVQSEKNLLCCCVEVDILAQNVIVEFRIGIEMFVRIVICVMKFARSDAPNDDVFQIGQLRG